MRSAIEAGGLLRFGVRRGIRPGTILVPLVEALGAILLELPVILTASWILCGWILRRFDPDRWQFTAMSVGRRHALAASVRRGSHEKIRMVLHETIPLAQ